MTVEAEKAIQFKCEKCDQYQHTDYTLEDEWFEERYVMSDRIDCECCGHENHVIEEL